MLIEKNWKKIIVVYTLIIMSLVLLFILPLGHDLWFHIYRIGAMAAELEKSPWQLPIRMLSETYNGYGYGAALYYGDLFLYIPAILVCLGMDEVLAYKVFTVLILWGTFGIAYFSARYMKKEKELAMLFALFYTFSSSSLLNLCIRSAIGESQALMVLPLVAVSFGEILYGKKRYSNWMLLGVGMSVIAMSHMLSLTLSIIALSIWCILEIKRVFSEKRLIEIIKAAGFMVGLSASFLFPILEQMLFQTVQIPGNNNYQKQAFMDYAVDWIDYFIPYEVKKILVTVFSVPWDIETWHPGTIGLFVVVIIGVFWALKPTLNKKQIRVFVGSMAALLMLSIKPVVNIEKEFMSFMEFPWRIMPMITLGLSISAVWILENSKCDEDKKNRMKWCMLVGTLLIAGWAIGPRYAYQLYAQRDNYAYVRENNPDFYEKYLIRYDKNPTDNMYLPEDVYLYTYLERGEVITANKEGIIYEWQREPKEIRIQIEDNPYTDVNLELPLYMYKGYAARNSKGEDLPIVISENGLVSVEVGNNKGDIMVWYKGTLVQKMSDIITFLTILWCLCVYGKIKLKQKLINGD